MGQINFALRKAELNRSSVARWVSEISFSSLVSPNINVNDNFQSQAFSKLKTARLVNR